MGGGPPAEAYEDDAKRRGFVSALLRVVGGLVAQGGQLLLFLGRRGRWRREIAARIGADPLPVETTPAVADIERETPTEGSRS